MEESPKPPQVETHPNEFPKDVANLAMPAHLLGDLVGFLGPLILWVVKKDEHEFIDDQSKEALNFQLTLLIWYFGAFVIAVLSCGFIFFAPWVPYALQLIFGIMGAVSASKGERYRYPMTIRFAN